MSRSISFNLQPVAEAAHGVEVEVFTYDPEPVGSGHKFVHVTIALPVGHITLQLTPDEARGFCSRTEAVAKKVDEQIAAAP